MKHLPSHHVSIPGLIAGLIAAVACVSSPATGQSTGQIRSAQEAIREFLLLQPGGEAAKQEAAALGKAVRACGNLKTAVAALRTLPPLSKAKPGTRHGVKFESGAQTFEYSIRLPKGYDDKTRFPVLVLPDHGLVDAEAGIGFWEQDRKLVERFIVFRPVICKYQTDKARFPEQQFFKRDAAMADVMRQALRHLRLHYAVDHDRFVLTGLSQAGYYTYYYAVSFPDDFAGIVPESAGGVVVRAAIRPLAKNLASMRVKILHALADQITPFSDATMMHDALRQVGGKVEFVKFTAADYKQPNPRQHPTPHDLRIANVLPFALACKRIIPEEVERVIRYPQQAQQGRFVVTPPESVQGAFELQATSANHALTSNRKGTIYHVSPEAVFAKQFFKVGDKRVRPKADLGLLLESFKSSGDPARLVAAAIEIG